MKTKSPNLRRLLLFFLRKCKVKWVLKTTCYKMTRHYTTFMSRTYCCRNFMEWAIYQCEMWWFLFAKSFRTLLEIFFSFILLFAYDLLLRSFAINIAENSKFSIHIILYFHQFLSICFAYVRDFSRLLKFLYT